MTEVATFSGGPGTAPPDSGTNANWTGSVTTVYASEVTTVTDQASKARRSVSDGLGRLKQVIEDPNGLAYSTTYGYDAEEAEDGDSGNPAATHLQLRPAV